MVSQEYQEALGQKEIREHREAKENRGDLGNRAAQGKEENQDETANLENRDLRVTMVAREDLGLRVLVAKWEWLASMVSVDQRVQMDVRAPQDGAGREDQRAIVD